MDVSENASSQPLVWSIMAFFWVGEIGFPAFCPFLFCRVLLILLLLLLD